MKKRNDYFFRCGTTINPDAQQMSAQNGWKIHNFVCSIARVARWSEVYDDCNNTNTKRYSWIKVLIVCCWCRRAAINISRPIGQPRIVCKMVNRLTITILRCCYAVVNGGVRFFFVNIFVCRFTLQKKLRRYNICALTVNLRNFIYLFRWSERNTINRFRTLACLCVQQNYNSIAHKVI